METSSDVKVAKVPFFPSVRFGMLVMWFLGSTAFYLIRFSFSVGIVCMTVDPTENVTINGSWGTTQTNADDSCGELDTEEQTGEFEWDRTMRGLINSAFFIGYFLTHVIGGVMALKYGSQWVITGGMAVAVLATLMFQVAAEASPWALFGMRIMLGLGCGVFVTSIRAVQFDWGPVYERSIIYSIQSSGYSIGSVVAFAMSGAICESFGWPWVYYVPAFIMVLWMVFWAIFGGDKPDSYKYISEKERQYIIVNRAERSTEKLAIPWGKIFTSLPCLGIFFTDFCTGWGGYTTLTSGAQYMKDVLKFDISSNGFYNALPHLCKCVMSISGGFVADAIRKKGILSTTATRKVLQTCSMMIPACMLIALAFLGCEQRGAAVAVLCISEGFAGLTRCAMGTAMLEVAPRFTSIIGGITNCFSTASGIIAPIAAALLTPNGSEEEWQKVFFIGSGIYTFGWLVFIIFVKAEEQPWAKGPDQDVILDKEVDISFDEKSKELTDDTVTKQDTHNGVWNGGFEPKGVELFNHTTELEFTHRF